MIQPVSASRFGSFRLRISEDSTSPPGVADYYDYYLVRGQWPGRGPFGRHLGDEIREVAKAGRWRLLERVRP
ncbi:hypothetical protein, partial [Pontiella sp.]|uniref:hypothetical protein n=1 Tax=Pontiella sp. TaxID=2837462 RepID=UPI003561F421